MYSSIMRHLVIPLYDFATGNPTRKYMKELEKSQWFSPQKIRQLQEKKLRCLIRHAYNTVPYYRRIFRENRLNVDDITSLDDLEKLPILSRNEVREESDALISRGYPKKKIVCGVTGGSTGEPNKFCTTRENRRWATSARYLSWRWAGFEIGGKFAQASGLRIDQPTFESFRGKIEGATKRRISMYALQTSEEKIAKFLQKMKAFKPEMLYGNAEIVASLAKFVEDKGMERFHLNSVIIDSMSLFRHEIEMIERVFGCRVWWNYHNRENGTFASECSEHNGYHLFSQLFVFELVKEGERVALGEAGSILVTDLTNYAMPFIRYEVGDMGVLSSDICACGRGLPVMKKLLGRTSMVLVSATGEFVIGPFYVCLENFFEAGKIKQYQIIQETPARVIVRIIPTEAYSSEDTETVTKEMRKILGNVEIEVKLLDTIAKSSSGKRKVVVRKFPLKFT